MRYFVQILTMNSASREAAATAVNEKLIDRPDRTSGYVQGEADDEAIRTLRDRGLLVRVLSEIKETPRLRVRRGVTTMGLPTRRRPSTPSLRYVLELQGALTTEVRNRLGNLGIVFLERLPSGDWAVRVEGNRDLDEIQRDPIVRSIAQPPPPAPRQRSATSDRSIQVVDYEAILFLGFPSAGVAEQLKALGAEIHFVSESVVRFSLREDALDRVRQIGAISSVEPIGRPSVFNDMALLLIGAQEPLLRRKRGAAGEGEIVGIADTGLDVDHPDFAGRIVKVETLGRPGDGSDPHGHGTHVAGTIAGSGEASNGLLAGVAPGAEIYFQSLLDDDGGLGGLPADMADLMGQAYAAGVRVHNNSWGIFLHARYASISFAIDRFVSEHPDFLVVVAAGNDGSCEMARNSSAGFVDYPSVASPASAKNVLTVGASRSSRAALGFAGMTYGEMWPRQFPDAPISTQAVSGDANCLAGFSARGPCDDRRIKPDVVAPGTDIASARSASAPLRNFWGAYPHNEHYALMGGTSMACPLVTGIAVLVRQYLRNKRDHDRPSAALLRAVVINGARRISGSDAVAPPAGEPNFHQGFGRVSLETSVPPDDDPSFRLEFVDTLAEPDLEFRESGEVRQFKVEVSTAGDLRLCLAWTDPVGRSVQNALSLFVETPAGDISVSNPKIARMMGLPTPAPVEVGDLTYDRDPDNNAQSIVIEAAEPGPYVITVLADNLLWPGQGFALVATGPIVALNQTEI